MKKKKNQKINFWLNHIPENILICYKRVVVIFNGHSYVVLKYVVAKQIKCKNCITSEKAFCFIFPEN